MSVELDEVYRFIAQHEPFSHLPEATLAQLPAQMAITYVRRGEHVVEPGQRNDTLYIIRSGAIDIVGDDDLLLDRREAGLNFGYSTLVGEPESRYLMQAVEDSVLLMLPREAFDSLLHGNPDLKRYFQTASRRVRAAAEEVQDSGSADMLRTPLADLIRDRELTSCPPTVSIAQAAQMMDERRVTCLVIASEGTEPGILTDRDLRSRVVARRVDPDRPVGEVMTSPVQTISADALVFEAMLVMSERGIHHLPVEDAAGISGVLTSSDIMRLLHTDPIYLAADVEASSLADLEGAFGRAAEVAVRFFERGASAAEAQRLLTSIADSVAKRLYTLGVEKLGPPPVPFAFVAAGSQARGEMGPASDQDNAIVLSNDYDESEHGQYFADLSNFLCRGLAAAGQALCPGDMMASNAQWRMTEGSGTGRFTGG